MLPALFVSILLTLANSGNFLFGLINTKPGEVYLGTSHYWEDYFLYVSQFFQGAHGGWLTKNPYTSQPTPGSFLFWPNVMLGKLGGLAGLTPQMSYNVSVMLLSFTVLMTLFLMMRRVFPEHKKACVAFLLAATATSFMNYIWVDGRPMWYPFEQWKTPNFALDRLGGVPHQTLQTLLFLLVMRSQTTSTLVVGIVLLTTLNPVMSALFLLAAWVASPRRKLIVPSVSFMVVAWYYNAVSNAPPHIQSKLWEAGDQTMTAPMFMLLSIGPISALGIFGAWVSRNRFSIALLTISYLLYFSPIPHMIGVSNSRVLFPALYAAWGILAAEGVFFFKKPLIVVLIFFLLTLPTLGWEIKKKLTVKPEERIPLLYIPETVYQAIAYLKNQRPFDDIVLGNPVSHMDALVPAFSGHTGFTGHPFATVANEDKKTQSRRFFAGLMPQEEAKQWLAGQSIRYVLFTQFDGDNTYPFLTREFSSTGATVWSW